MTSDTSLKKIFKPAFFYILAFAFILADMEGVD
jgi:hypothetical protein